MKAQQIETALNELKVNSLGRIRGKGKVINKIQNDHYKSIDSVLMDVRIFVARLSTGHSTKDALQMIDEFIYQKQVE